MRRAVQLPGNGAVCIGAQQQLLSDGPAPPGWGIFPKANAQTDTPLPHFLRGAAEFLRQVLVGHGAQQIVFPPGPGLGRRWGRGHALDPPSRLNAMQPAAHAAGYLPVRQDAQPRDLVRLPSIGAGTAHYGASEAVAHRDDRLVAAAQAPGQLRVGHSPHQPHLGVRPLPHGAAAGARIRPLFEANVEDHAPPYHPADSAAQHPRDFLVGPRA